MAAVALAAAVHTFMVGVTPFGVSYGGTGSVSSAHRMPGRRHIQRAAVPRQREATGALQDAEPGAGEGSHADQVGYRHVGLAEVELHLGEPRTGEPLLPGGKQLMPLGAGAALASDDVKDLAPEVCLCE